VYESEPQSSANDRNHNPHSCVYPDTIVILMAPSFGAGGPMPLCLQRPCRPGVHRSSGLQRAQAIRMTTDGNYTHSFVEAFL
jgi:hypothetical protein